MPTAKAGLQLSSRASEQIRGGKKNCDMNKQHIDPGQERAVRKNREQAEKDKMYGRATCYCGLFTWSSMSRMSRVTTMLTAFPRLESWNSLAT